VSCATTRAREARRRQERRGGSAWRTNAEIPDPSVDELVDATPEARALLGRAVEGLGLSARAARRVLRVGRTIADLEGDRSTGPGAIAEALGYRDDWSGGATSAR
jgi:magnesium chelatase family protein